MRARLDMLVSVLLLPLFFALTGMRTTRPAERGQNLVLGRYRVSCRSLRKDRRSRAGCQMEWSDVERCCGPGSITDTRGLVELIVLNIAYNVGAFTPTLFTMLVVMALVTTILTTPILNMLGVKNAEKSTENVEAAA